MRRIPRRLTETRNATSESDTGVDSDSNDPNPEISGAETSGRHCEVTAATMAARPVRTRTTIVPLGRWLQGTVVSFEGVTLRTV